MPNEPVLKKSNSLLPKEISKMTLNELMNQDDVEIIKKRNIVKMKKTMEDQTISLEVHRYNYGETISQSRFNKPKNKKDLVEVVKKMYNEENLTQKQIAFNLDISQAYVSILLKEND